MHCTDITHNRNTKQIMNLLSPPGSSAYQVHIVTGMSKLSDPLKEFAIKSNLKFHHYYNQTITDRLVEFVLVIPMLHAHA